MTERKAYRREDFKLYSTARWQALREQQLAEQPLCRLCTDMGRITAASVCDHITPHKGDEQAFWDGPFQSLCAPCHDYIKREIEAHGYHSAIGIDGYPLDPDHLFNRKK